MNEIVENALLPRGFFYRCGLGGADAVVRGKVINNINRYIRQLMSSKQQFIWDLRAIIREWR